MILHYFRCLQNLTPTQKKELAEYIFKCVLLWSYSCYFSGNINANRISRGSCEMSKWIPKKVKRSVKTRLWSVASGLYCSLHLRPSQFWTNFSRFVFGFRLSSQANYKVLHWISRHNIVRKAKIYWKKITIILESFWVPPFFKFLKKFFTAFFIFLNKTDLQWKKHWNTLLYWCLLNVGN